MPLMKAISPTKYLINLAVLSSLVIVPSNQKRLSSCQILIRLKMKSGISFIINIITLHINAE